MTGVGQEVKDKVRQATARVLEQELGFMATAGDLEMRERPASLARQLAEGLERVGLLSLTGDTAIALELVAAGWAPVGDDLAQAAVHGIHLSGIVQSGEEDHVADYLRVMEAQHTSTEPRPLDDYRALARRVRAAYADATPERDGG